MSEKIALVASGGGMSCSYTAGVLNALVNHYRFEDPDLAVAGSGSAGTFAYYASGQYSSLTHVWSKLLSTRKFINKARFWKIIDIDYLIDEVFKIQHPIDISAIQNSPINFLVAATNFKTGDLNYFSVRGMDSPFYIFEILRASKAMPMAFNKKIIVDGEKYCDSYLSSHPKAHLRKAVEMGAKKVVVIDNRVSRGRNEKIFNLWLSVQSRAFKNSYTTKQKEADSYSPPPDVDVAYINPTSAIKVDTFSSSHSDLAESIQMGYDDAIKNTGLKRLLG